MNFNTQTDPKWSAEIMTTKESKWTDRIGRWGCFITAISNILSVIFIEKQITPKDLNDIIIKLKAYAYLDNEETPESNASFLMTEKLFKFFPSLQYEKKVLYVEDDHSFYIAGIIHPLTGGLHYVNVLAKRNGQYIIFDVEDGRVKTITNYVNLCKIRKV